MSYCICGFNYSEFLKKQRITKLEQEVKKSKVPSKTYLTSQQYQSDIWKLAADIRRSDWQPDFIVGLWRGGAPVAISIHEFFKATGWDVKHLPLKCWSYTGIGTNSSNVDFLLGDAIFGMFRKGDRVLFVDDVFDTGQTAAAVMNKMKQTGAEAKIACVYWKTGKNKTEVQPDYVSVHFMNNEWLVFPHEIDGLDDSDIKIKDPELHKLLTEFKQ